MITDSEMKAAVLRGLEAEVKILLSRQYGAGGTLQKVLDETVSANLSALRTQITTAVLALTREASFVTLLRDEIIRASKGKFKGTFDGVLHAAAKRAADDALIRDAIVSAATPSRDIPDSGCDLIATERRRQIEVEGYTAENDDRYHLHMAAAAYASQAYNRKAAQPIDWPFSPRSWKPSTPLRNLVKAGALIAAAIDKELRKMKT